MLVGNWQLTKKKRTYLIIIIILLQIALLAAMVLNSYAVLFRGESILLKVEPIDPRSLFQGDYVRLGYSFSNLDLTKIQHDLDPQKIAYQEKIYLVLEEREQTWEVALATQDKGKVQGRLYIEAKILYRTPGNLSDEQLKAMQEKGVEPPLNSLQLKLPIEQFYLPEGKGLALEKQITDGNVYAQVAIYQGKARVIDLISK